MKKEEIIGLIRQTESPLKRQLLTVALVSYLLQKKGKEVPIIIGGLALSYYTREVYFTADIDLVYSDREALDEVLTEVDCEMAELLVVRYLKELDWDYLEEKARKPENDLIQELDELKTKSEG